MGTVAAATPVPSTMGRLEMAWEQAVRGTKRAVLAATVTAVLVAQALPSSVAVRIASAAVGVLLVAAALVDIHERRLPNRLLMLGGTIAVAGAVLADDRSILLGAVLGGSIAGASMLIVRLTRGVGMGDVKAAIVVGASAGSVTLVAAPVAIAVTSFVAAAYGLLAHRSRVPLGPSLWIGWALALFGTSSGWWS